MSSDYLNTATWRLREGAAAIPYRVVSRSGALATEEGRAEEVVLIEAFALQQYAAAVLPDVFDLGGKPVWAPQKQFSAGTNLWAQELTWKTHVPGKPVDPYAVDLAAADGTYHEILEVTVIYKPVPPGETFLSVTADAAGEFLHIVPHKGDIASSSSADSTPAAGSNPNRYEDIPAIITVPITRWTVTWRRLPQDIFNDTIIDLIRAKLGKVNSKKMPRLYNPEPDTILFLGYSYRNDYTWRSKDDYTVTVEFRFKEKHVDWNGKVHGHNSVYVPQEGGWRKITINELAEEQYEATDLNELFSLVS